MIVNYFKNIGFSLLGVIVWEFLLTTLNYFNIINSNVLRILSLIGLFVSLFIVGIMTGRCSSKKGYLEGIKVSLIFVIIVILFNFLAFNIGIGLKNILLYIILIIIGMIGSMIGINKAAKE